MRLALNLFWITCLIVGSSRVLAGELTRLEVESILRSTPAGQSASFAGLSLAGADLHDLDFTNADLSGADLSEADLRGAKLVGSKLIGAKLPRARYDNPNLYVDQIVVGVCEERCVAQRSSPLRGRIGW